MQSVLFYLPTDLIGLPRIPVFAFGMMIVVAFLVALWIARRRAARASLDVEGVTDLCLYAMAAGLVGARLTWLIFDWTPDPSGDHFLVAAIKIWEGGLTYQGGLVLGIAVVCWYMHTRFWPVGRYLDVMAPSVFVGAALGRIGCFLNGCCWGRLAHATNAWGVTFPEGSPAAKHQMAMAGSHTSEGGWHFSAAWIDKLESLGYTFPPVKEPPLPVLPTQLMETAGYLALVAVLLLVERLWRRGRFPGFLMGLGVALYSIFRFVIEYYRDDTPLISLADTYAYPFVPTVAFTFGQWTAMATLVFALACLLVGALRARRGPRAIDGGSGHDEAVATPPPSAKG